LNNRWLEVIKYLCCTKYVEWSEWTIYTLAHRRRKAVIFLKDQAGIFEQHIKLAMALLLPALLEAQIGSKYLNCIVVSSINNLSSLTSFQFHSSQRPQADVILPQNLLCSQVNVLIELHRESSQRKVADHENTHASLSLSGALRVWAFKRNNTMASEVK
jgi:hypothetical protein